RDVLARWHRQQRKGLADLRVVARDPGDSELGIGLEQPAILFLLLRVLGRRELEEAVRQHQAAVFAEFAPVGAHVEYRLARRCGPRPARPSPCLATNAQSARAR